MPGARVPSDTARLCDGGGDARANAPKRVRFLFFSLRGAPLTPRLFRSKIDVIAVEFLFREDEQDRVYPSSEMQAVFLCEREAM